MKPKLSRLLVMFLIVAMSVCMMPGAGLFTGAEAVYADSVYLSGGTVNASTMTIGADYYITGDTIINVDDYMSVGTINIGNGVQLTLEGDDAYTLSARKVESYNGNFTINSGGLEIDSSDEESSWPAAIELTVGTFKMNGGNLFINFSSYSASANTSYAITAWNVEFNGGTATITISSYAHGGATGISTRNFTMTGGSVGVNAEARVSSAPASGISASGATANANFYMDGGELRAEGWASNAESYGINWTADKTQNSLSIYGGKIEATGQYRGLCSWAPIYIEGADIYAKATGNSAVAIGNGNGAEIGIYGANTKVVADAPLGYGVMFYNATINLAPYINIVSPAGGVIKPYGSSANAIFESESSSAPAKYVELQAGDPIPTNIAITYDASKAFPTTRLTGYQVSLHLLRNVTSNPGEDNAANGWYVYDADPNKTDTETSNFTCLVRRNPNGTFDRLNESDDLLNNNEEYYFRFNIDEDGTRPFDPSLTYTATVNGYTADYVDQPTGGNGEMNVYYHVDLDETHDVIWSLRVAPVGAQVNPGHSRQFTATAYAATDDAVEWSISGQSSIFTFINTDTGLLSVAGDEPTDHYITVRATSTADANVYDEVNVYVTNATIGIDNVTLSCDKTDICRGTNATITATVEGTDIHDLKWELLDSDGSSYFTGGSNLHRYLKVGEDEHSEFLTVRATSVANPAKYDDWVFHVVDKEVITGPINIEYDASAVTLSESKTGMELTGEFRTAITSPKGVGLEEDTAPKGWYVYINDGDSFTSLVRKNGDGFLELDSDTEYLNPEYEYYLWFNIDECNESHFFDTTIDIASMGVTVNGKRANNADVIAKWGGKMEVYVRIYFPGQEPDPSDALERIAGANRFLTAFAAADKLKAEMGVEKFPNVVIASGMAFPDALAGAYLAVQKSAPVLLTYEGVMNDVADYVKANMADGGQVFILGGPAAVPETMEEALEAQDITNTMRLMGSNRYETNIEILKAAGVTDKDLLVCAGTGYADSLSASATGKPILLVGESLTPAQKEYLESVQSDLSGNVYAIGGTKVVTDAVFDEVKAYAGGITERVAGANRFLTSTAIAEKFFKTDIDTVVVAYAMNYPDGLSGGPVAFFAKAPLLLVDNNNYTAAKDYVQGTFAHFIKVMGGDTLISDEVALEIIK